MTVLAFTDTGHRDEARDWGNWLRRAVAGARPLQSLYGLGGERWIPEREVHWLAGYEASQPVRIGNAAMEQHQLDVFGEMELAFRREIEMGFVTPHSHWGLRKALIEHLIAIWREPDEGIWEVRGGAQQFTYSKAMAWAAIDCAIRSAEEHGLAAPLDAWRKVRAEIFECVCQRGFNASCGAFTQTLDGENLDASVLMLPLIGFLPPQRSADHQHGRGDWPGTDGGRADPALFDARDQGRVATGRGHVSGLQFLGTHRICRCKGARTKRSSCSNGLGLCNDVGLLAEEYDHEACRQVGNFPQAFSHLALIGTALVLDGGVKLL